MVFKYLHPVNFMEFTDFAGFQVNLPDYNEQGFGTFISIISSSETKYNKRIFMTSRQALSALVCSLVMLFGVTISQAQTSFVDVQKSSMRVSSILINWRIRYRSNSKKMKLSWPPQSIYIRAFKYDRQLEIWVKGESSNEPYKLFKSYKICMQSGTMGPKRMQGDYQVPEGFIISTNLT